MTTSGRTPRAVLLLSAAVFVALTAAVIVLGGLPLDASARAAILHAATPEVVAAMRVVNLGGNWRLVLPGTLFFFVFFPRSRARWWIWIALMVVAPISEGLLKVIVGRHRPEDISFGFPSGHATAAAAFFGAVMYLAATLPAPARRAVRLLAPVCIVLVALARVVLRAHWPSDALAGIALGLGLASVAMLIDQTFGGLASPETPGRATPDTRARRKPPLERESL